MKRSQLVSSVALFAALNVVCDLLVGLPSAGVWFGMIAHAKNQVSKESESKA